MTKNELIRLINCGIEIKNDWDLKRALKMNHEMLDVFFNTFVDKKIAYLFIDVCEDVDKYKYVLDCLAKVNNKKLQHEFIPLISRLRDVPFNNFWKTAIAEAVSIPTIELFDQYLGFVTDKKVLSLNEKNKILFIKTIKNHTDVDLMHNMATIYSSSYDNKSVESMFVDSLNLKLDDFSRMINLIAKNIEYELHLPMINSIKDILSEYSMMSSRQLDKKLSYLEEQIKLSYSEKSISLSELIKECPNKLLEALEQLDSNIELSTYTKVKIKTISRD